MKTAAPKEALHPRLRRRVRGSIRLSFGTDNVTAVLRRTRKPYIHDTGYAKRTSSPKKGHLFHHLQEEKLAENKVVTMQMAPINHRSQKIEVKNIVRTPFQSARKNIGKKNGTDVSQASNAKNRNSSKTLASDPGVDFGSMTALVDKNNPNVVSHSKFESTPQESTDEHVEIENRRRTLVRTGSDIGTVAASAIFRKTSYTR